MAILFHLIMSIFYTIVQVKSNTTYTILLFVNLLLPLQGLHVLSELIGNIQEIIFLYSELSHLTQDVGGQIVMYSLTTEQRL